MSKMPYNSKPSKQHVDGLVDEFNQKHELSQSAMIASPDLVEMGNCIDCSEETAVQPSTTLENELGHTVGHISLTRGRLDILK